MTLSSSKLWHPDFLGGSDGRKFVCNAGDTGRSLGWEDPREEGIATHFSILAWRIPLTEEPDRLQCMGLQRVRHHWSNLAHTHTHTHTRTGQQELCTQSWTQTSLNSAVLIYNIQNHWCRKKREREWRTHTSTKCLELEMLHNTSRAGPLVRISHTNLPKWKAKSFHMPTKKRVVVDEVRNTHFYHRSKERHFTASLNSKYKRC